MTAATEHSPEVPLLQSTEMSAENIADDIADDIANALAHGFTHGEPNAFPNTLPDQEPDQEPHAFANAEPNRSGSSDLRDQSGVELRPQGPAVLRGSCCARDCGGPWSYVHEPL